MSIHQFRGTPHLPMRIPYFIWFYSSLLLLLSGIAVDGGSDGGYGLPSVLLALAMVALLWGVVDVVATHKRQA